MPRPLTIDDARQSLADHAAVKGTEIHDRYGPTIGWSQLLRILDDRNCVRYPCEVAFDASPLQPGECAHPVPKGDRPEDGFTMHVHPLFLTRLAEVPIPILYQLVLVNYGEFASSGDAERFGAAALGISQEEYYLRLCALSDLLGPSPGVPGACAESGCH